MPNRLALETSPYLRQHAENPVDWYPWGAEALGRAAAEGKPILLSIGYSACHWCHVMAHESFEDPGVAAVMNARFVNVKVDREERPDVDALYMKAVQAFTGGHGGWPMTVFLTPDGRPYFGGTYFPPAPSRGMPSFLQVLDYAHRAFAERRAEVEAMASEVLGHVEDRSRLPRGGPGLEGGWLEAAAQVASETLDPVNGGFGGAPKFPPHGLLVALLAHHTRTGSAGSLEAVRLTCERMALGGMYDHLGGGFSRYSVDAEWRVPHFEKMLYDNAQLVPVYLELGQITGDLTWHRIVEQTLGYVLREMTLPEGAFCAAQDADTEGVEGRAFVWTLEELKGLLGSEAGSRAARLLEVTSAGTFEHGASVLRLASPWSRLPPADRAFLDDVAFPCLRAARASRAAPARDDKVVAAWTGLMVSAFARAGSLLERSTWVDQAVAGGRFIGDRLTVGGRLQRSWFGGKVSGPAFLDDHGAVLLAYLDLWEATFDASWIDAALHLADQVVDLFWEDAVEGFYVVGRDAEQLVVRAQEPVGGAEPGGNGLVALAFLRLGALCSRGDLADKARRVLRSLQPLLERAARAFGLELLAAEWATGPTAEVGIVGDRLDPGTQALLRTVRRRVDPFRVVAVVPPDDPSLGGRVPWMADRGEEGPGGVAWVCQGSVCYLPCRTGPELDERLDRLGRPSRVSRPRRPSAPPLPAAAEAWLGTASPLSLEGLVGRVVVLDFWTYCCINCLHVLPELEAVERRFGARVRVIGVHSPKFPAERDPGRVREAMQRHRVEHPVVVDPDHDVWRSYGVESWPTVVVLDTQGRVAWRRPGEVSREELGDVVQRLLDEAGQGGSEGVEASPSESSLKGLRHPGRVHVWPEGGAPEPAPSRLYVSDTGRDRVLECSLSLDAQGVPAARVLRVLDGGGAPLRGPQGVFRHANELWVADTGNHQLKVVDLATGSTRVVAGTGRLGRGGQGDPADPNALDLRSPWDVVVDDHVAFIAMAGAHQVWVHLRASGHTGPFAGSGREDHTDGPVAQAAFAQPSGLAWWGRYLFVADSEVSSVRAIDLERRTVGTLVGRGLFDFGDVDGPADEARLQHPLAVAMAGEEIFVADTFNNKIKCLRLGRAGAMHEVHALVGGLHEPGGLAAFGTWLLVADTNAHRIMAVHRSSGELRELVLHDLT